MKSRLNICRIEYNCRVAVIKQLIKAHVVITYSIFTDSQLCYQHICVQLWANCTNVKLSLDLLCGGPSYEIYR
jgi:hypothetical protein